MLERLVEWTRSVNRKENTSSRIYESHNCKRKSAKNQSSSKTADLVEVVFVLAQTPQTGEFLELPCHKPSDKLHPVAHTFGIEFQGPSREASKEEISGTLDAHQAHSLGPAIAPQTRQLFLIIRPGDPQCTRVGRLFQTKKRFRRGRKRQQR